MTKRSDIRVRIIEPDQLETRDLVADPDALECLSKIRAKFLTDADKRLVVDVECEGSSTVWKYGPSWAVAVLDEIWAIHKSYASTIRFLLRRAVADTATRDAVIAATLVGDRAVLRLAQQQRYSS